MSNSLLAQSSNILERWEKATINIQQEGSFPIPPLGNGTCVYVRNGSNKYLFTVAHVLQQSKEMVCARIRIIHNYGSRQILTTNSAFSLVLDVDHPYVWDVGKDIAIVFM